jgi:3-oxoadipate enol-lactonase
MTDRFLDVPGARIAYDVDERDGGGTLVALHGLTQSRANDDASGVFGSTELAEVRQRVVRFDARGHGRSTGRTDPDDWRWTSLADDLLRLLDVVAPGRPVDALGVSMGTGTIVTAAVREPERFRRLVLTIPPTAWSTRPAQGAVYRQMADLIEQRGLAGLTAASAGAVQPLPVLEEGGWWPMPDPDMVEALAPTILRGSALADLPSEDEVAAALAMPVLLLPWAGDPGHPASTAERLHALLPQSELHLAARAEDIRGWAGRVGAFVDA